jgi:hypothetical protein
MHSKLPLLFVNMLLYFSFLSAEYAGHMILLDCMYLNDYSNENYNNGKYVYR